MNLKERVSLITFMALMLLISGVQGAEETSPPKKYNLSVCAVFRNEEKFLKEWIEYHRLVGVDHFYLYNLQSTDYYIRHLRSYIAQGIVTLMSWPAMQHINYDEQEDMAFALGIQIPAYEHASKCLAIDETKWLVNLDINEFLVPGSEGTLSSLLEKYENESGIILQSDFFDASKIDQFPKRDLIIQTVELSKRFHKNPFKEVKKTVFKPELTATFSWPPYTVHFKDSQQPIAVLKREMKINHYGNRFAGYITHDRVKERIDVDSRMISEYEMEALLDLGFEIEDQSREIFRFVPQLLQKLGCSYER